MKKLTWLAGAMFLTASAWGGVARIGGTEYDTLALALAAVQDGETLEVLADINENWPVVDKACTIDLGGHTVRGIYGQYNRTGGVNTFRNGTLSSGFDGKAGSADKFPNGAMVFENVTMNADLWSDSHPITIRNCTVKGILHAGDKPVVIESGYFNTLDGTTCVFYGGFYKANGSTHGNPAVGFCWVESGDATYPYTVVDGHAFRATWTGAANNGDLGDAANWSCVDAMGTVQADVVPTADAYGLYLNGDTAFNCPVGSTKRWHSVNFAPFSIGSAPSAKMGYFRRPTGETYSFQNNSWKQVGQYNTDFVHFPPSYMNYVGDVNVPNDFGNTTWKNNYLNNATVRIDGWMFVTAEQAGSWVASVYADDYIGFAMDGVWLAISKTYTASATGAAYDVKPGWHRYTIVGGDTYGSEALHWVKIAINGESQVDLNSSNFTLGTAANYVRLTADCDWRGLGTLEFPAGFTLDLNGHNLAIAGAKGTFKNGVTISNTGTLTVDGGTFDNNGISVPDASVIFTNSVVVKATWMGAGDLGNVNDPANWSCQDADGHTVAGGIPGAVTVVTLDAATSLQIPAGQTLTTSYIQPSTGVLALSADCDWRGGFTASALPSNFYGTRLPYLDAPKNSFINTGIAANSNLRIVMDVTVQGSAEYWFGAWDTSDWRGTSFCFCNDNTEMYVAYGVQNHGCGNGSAVANGRHTIEANRNYFLVDGTLKVDRLPVAFSFADAIYLFAQNRAGTAAPQANQGTIRFHGCRIYNADTLVRDLVPVQKDDGAVGAYDLVNKVFYGNGGSGAFAAGIAGYVKSQTTLVPPAPVDLAGHALDLAPAADIFAATVTDTSAGAPGTLRLHVAAEQNFSTTAFTLSGNQKVVVDAAGAEFELGTKLVGLAGVPPTSVTFELDAATAAHGVDLVVSEYGVFYGADPNSPNAVYAHWTGAAGDGDPTNGGNWCATNLAGRAIANPVLNTETDVFFHDAATVKVPSTGFAWKQLRLSEGNVLTLDATDWTGAAGDAIITTVLGMTPTNDLWSRVRIVNASPRLDVALSADGRSLVTIGKSNIAWRFQKYGVNRPDMTEDCTFRLMPLAGYTTLVMPTNVFSCLTTGYKTTWQATYLSQSQSRLDGWFLVTAEQAGTWLLTQGYDDYEAFAIDGDWKILNPTFTHGEEATVELTAGWHHFTLVLGDTYGGYGCGSDSIRVTSPGRETAVAFDERNFTFEDPSAFTTGDFAISVKGEVPMVTLNVAATCRVVLDPAQTQLVLLRAPSFEPGAKIALAAKYAAATSGSFTLMTWTQGTLDAYGSSLASIFDKTSANGANPLVQVVENGDGSHSLVLSLDGANDAVSAHWTGAVDNDCTKAENWLCTNAAGDAITAVPGWGTAVYIDDGACNFNVPVGTTFPHGKFSLASSITLSADCDWRGLDVAAESLAGTTIDVNGHTLYLSSSVDLTAGTITSGASDGSLHIEVPASTSIVNTGLALTGSLQFVKEGEGRFVAKRQKQSYSGGNLVNAGTLACPARTTAEDLAGSPASWQGKVLGENNTLLKVMPTATLDIGSNYDFNVFTIELAGGTVLVNGLDQTKDTWGALGGFTLTADSTLKIDATLFQGGDFDLNGHTLTVLLANSKYWKPKACTFADHGGKIVVTGPDGTSTTEGMLWNYGDIKAPTVDFYLNCRLEIKNNVTVRDFTYRRNALWSWSELNKKVSVLGTFTPIADHFCNVELQNGAVIDLSSKSDTWSTKSLSYKTVTENEVSTDQYFYTTFAEGAIIGVKLGERTFRQGDCVIAWDTPPTSVKFVCRDSNMRTLSQRADGLYVYTGFTIYLK